MGTTEELVIAAKQFAESKGVAYRNIRTSAAIRTAVKMSQNEVVIYRVVRPVQPYPRNGNVSTQRPAYDWIVRVNGKYAGMSRLLRTAKEIASEYGTPKIIRE